MSKQSTPSIKTLFLTYTKIGILGFGGVAAVARYVIVEERKWLDEKEYATYLGVGQILPGPNTINVAVMIGERYQGKLGSLVCVIGIMFLPAGIAVALGIAYDQFSTIPHVQTALIGASAAAAGTFLGTGLKMLGRIQKRMTDYLIIGLTIVLVAGFHVSLVTTVLALIPTSIAIKWIANR